MAVAALALYGVWFLLAFGVRIAVQVRRTGDTGFRGVATSQGWLGILPGVLFTLALFLGVAAPIADLVGLGRIDALDTAVVGAAGVVLATAGVVLTLVVQLAMGNAWRIGVDETERTDLVTEGPFRVVRNPIFSVMLLTAVGLALMVPNVIAVIAVAALVVGLELTVRLVEEPYLLRTHGTAYRSYAARVGRFVPAIGRWS
jgi:protein-S-isoprenylcysteine O-methyltransferase Ste14